jgi:hypothetical protein
MSEMSQLASAVLALVFATIMLVTGQLYIKRMSAKTFIIPTAQESSSKQFRPVQFGSIVSNPSHEAN